ncbi:MAG: DUF1294 domain-containing protein [Selenomonadaceae bacterium]|nr:DUF1294 domain-containing protein [Selenomonadaceae bacterium]
MEFQGHNLSALYFVVINIVAIAVYGWDKLCAVRKWWRVPEMTLIAIALIGGSIGEIVAMRIFRHKTLHLKFKYGLPFILILQIAGVVYLHLPK